MDTLFSDRFGKRMLAAFGAGALCALILPKLFLTVLGAAVILTAAVSLSTFSHKEY